MFKDQSRHTYEQRASVFYTSQVFCYVAEYPFHTFSWKADWYDLLLSRCPSKWLLKVVVILLFYTISIPHSQISNLQNQCSRWYLFLIACIASKIFILLSTNHFIDTISTTIYDFSTSLSHPQSIQSHYLIKVTSTL